MSALVAVIGIFIGFINIKLRHLGKNHTACWAGRWQSLICWQWSVTTFRAACEHQRQFIRGLEQCPN
jgi:hypothetical protein